MRSSSGAHCADDVLRVVVYAEDQDPHGGQKHPQLLRHLEAAEAGQREVEHDHIGQALLREREGGVAVARFPHDLESRCGGEDMAYAFADDRVIVHQHDSDCGFRGRHPRLMPRFLPAPAGG